MTPTPWDLFAIGDLSIDTYISVPYFPGADQKAIGKLLGVYGGGMSANFAAAAAAAGAKTLYQTRLGSDTDGLRALDELKGQGVDTSPSSVVPGARTFQCYVQLDASGEKALIGADTGVKVPDVGDVDPAHLASSRYVYLLADDLTWADGMADAALLAGAEVVVDLERSAFDRSQDIALELVGKSAMVFSNTKAHPDPALRDAERLAHLIAECGPRLTVVTDGANGALAIGSGDQWFQPGLPTEVRDSTGAGDAHNGTFFGRVIAGASVPDALLAAASAGSKCVAQLGARAYLCGDPVNSIQTPPFEEEVQL